MVKLNIVDTTLRDGEQTAGVIFSLSEKIQIAKGLDKLGVEIIEAGIPAMGSEEMLVIGELLKLNLNAKIMTWNRMLQEDIEKSIECGAKYIHISAPVSDIHIYKKLKKDRKWILYQTKKCINFAKSKGCHISLGAEDSSRADIDFLIDYFKLGESLGVERVRYADTVSALEPIKTYETIKKIREYINIPIDFHGHNDFGAATGNSLAALRAGAEYISCSINGLGERAGNTPLEEVLMGASYLLDAEHKYNIKELNSLSKIVSEFSGKRVSDMKPIIGESVFSHESGIHVDGLLKEEKTYELLSPKELGRERKIVIGKHTGTTGIMRKLRDKGFSINESEAQNIIESLRKELSINKRLNIEDFIDNYLREIAIKEVKMVTKYGVLKGVEDAEYYKNGLIKACRLNEKNILKTSLGDLVPQYETKDERRKITGTIEFYDNGELMSVCLDEQITVKTAYGEIPAEKITFFKGEKIKRIFPLNGKLSGYWGEENEYSLASTIGIKNGDFSIMSKFISLAFYENQSIRSLTLWPKERIEISTDLGSIKIRKGISFFEDGMIKSFEPASELKVKTPIGEINAFNNEIVGLHGDDNSVQLDSKGNIRSLYTCSSRIKIIKGETTDVLEPLLKKGWCNELIEVPVPLKITFDDKKIVFDNKKIYDINNQFFIERVVHKTLAENVSC